MMASRSRQSGTTPAPSQQRTVSRLPDYQKPQFALNAQAQRMIDNLFARHDFKKLQDQYSSSVSTLSESVADINERVAERRQQHEKLAKRKAQDTPSDDEEPLDDGAQALKELDDKVQNMTKRIDENIRKTLDGQHSIERTERLLTLTAQDARVHATQQASMPPRQSQRAARAARLPRDSDDEGDEEDEPEYPEIDPTAPEESTPSITGPVEFYKEELEKSKLLYESRSLVERYAEHTSYRQFRKLMHNAQFPDEEVAEPQPQDWFDEAGRARPGVTQRPGEDDEDDIQIQRAKTSTKCPITLQEFREPLTSNKCEHTFEASAIHEMIQVSVTRIGQKTDSRGRTYGGIPAVRCPVQSCDQILAKSDLYHNAAVARIIQRLQRAAEIEALEHSRVENGPELIDDDDEEDAMDVDDIEADEVPSTAPVKLEKTRR